MLKEITLAHTQGFCAGVAMAIDVVEIALKKYGTPLYVRHHIVHNTSVIKDFEKRGVIFIEELHEVPDNQTVIFSAHGTAPEVFEEAKRRGLNYIDASCPLVVKVHRRAQRFSKDNVQTVLIGHEGHQEVIGTSGYVDESLLHIVDENTDVSTLNIDPEKPLGYLTQTTLSVSDTKDILDRLKERFPNIQGAAKADICYATQNRQDAVKELAKGCDVIIICGSPASSNSNRLVEKARQHGVKDSYIIDTVTELDLSWLEGKERLGISSGASVPRRVVDDVVAKIKSVYPDVDVKQDESIEKDIYFELPTI